VLQCVAVCCSVLQCVAVLLGIRHPRQKQWRIWMSHVTHRWRQRPTNLSTNSCSTTTGWRRLIGCLKVQVIFRKRATNYRALLRKMTYEDQVSYDSTPPCITQSFNLAIYEIDAYGDRGKGQRIHQQPVVQRIQWQQLTNEFINK